MLPAEFILFAAAIRLGSGASYAWAVIQNRAKPNPVTWFFWALAPAIVFWAQLFDGVGWGLAITFALGFGPLVIFILSLKNNLKRSHFTPSTIACGILATIGIALWLTTNDASLAIIFSILADIFGSIPTIIKVWRDPSSEFLPAYLITVLSVIITALTISEWRFATYAFPAYIFAINIIIFCAGALSPNRSRTKRNKVKRLTSTRQ